ASCDMHDWQSPESIYVPPRGKVQYRVKLLLGRDARGRECFVMRDQRILQITASCDVADFEWTAPTVVVTPREPNDQEKRAAKILEGMARPEAILGKWGDGSADEAFGSLKRI